MTIRSEAAKPFAGRRPTLDKAPPFPEATSADGATRRGWTRAREGGGEHGRVDLRLGQGRAVCGYVFRPGEPGRNRFRGAARRLAAPAGERDAFLWLHFNLANTASLRWIDQHLTLPDAFREARRQSSPASRSPTMCCSPC